jgi:V/A-type H+/Na+-transporting ATPase subunit E
MEAMDKISAAILEKVREEAREIIRDAEDKGKQEVESAKKNREVRLENERRRIIGEAEAEAARVSAQASIAERQELLSAKSAVLAEIITKVRKSMSSVSSEANLTAILKESISGLGVDEVNIYVAVKDSTTVKNLLKKDKDLGTKIKAVESIDCSGGAIIESIDGSLRVDNTYDTRLEMILPRVMPQISKELFPNS